MGILLYNLALTLASFGVILQYINQFNKISLIKRLIRSYSHPFIFVHLFGQAVFALRFGLG